MAEYTIDRWADPGEFSTEPSAHDVDRIEFLDVDIESITHEPNPDPSGYGSGEIRTTMTFGAVRAVRLWKDGEPLETVGFTEGGDLQ